MGRGGGGCIYTHQAGDARVLNEASVLELEPLRRSYVVERRQSCGRWGHKAWVTLPATVEATWASLGFSPEMD